MRRLFHHYELWEDWDAGMYRHTSIDQRLVELAGDLLSNPDAFRNGAMLMVDRWPYATDQNLTNSTQNRQAWVGQATATFTVGASRRETCIAWSTYLTDSERAAANRVADSVIGEWCNGVQQLGFDHA